MASSVDAREKNASSELAEGLSATLSPELGEGDQSKDARIRAVLRFIWEPARPAA